MRQGELVALELQCHGGLWLGDAARRACEGSQLGYFDHLPTCRDADEMGVIFASDIRYNIKVAMDS